MRLLARLAINAAALWVAVRIVPGIVFDGGPWGLFGVALVFGAVNTVVKPFAKVLGCPLIVLTLGLFLLIINALMLWLTGVLSESLGLGFHVAGFLPALIGGLVVSLVGTVISLMLPTDRERAER